MFGRRGLTDTAPAAATPPESAPAAEPPARPGPANDAELLVASAPAAPKAAPSKIQDAAAQVQGRILERIDSEVASRLPREELARELVVPVRELLDELKIQLNQREQRELVGLVLDDMLGLGPLEPLLADETITDIMVNGARQIYVEQRGKLVVTDAAFRDDAHVLAVASRIVSQVGRRVDESSPMVDARLLDGSRVNIIIPPLALDGPFISIRKFAKKGIDLDRMIRQGNVSAEMATVLKIAARSRLNILISGGTGSGKTTLLNALSQMISAEERVVTIEDAAELQLQQPHVIRLETRPSNLEGKGEVNMRDLVKNALRMRPDRIILGEVRGPEALDMLQAMNTGHDGSLGTIHANRPREALTRLENMVGMAGVNLPSRAVRTQIAAAIQLIVQISRMRDGIRRITSITEVVGMEGDVVTTQELFAYRFEGEGPDGLLRGHFESAGLRPAFSPRAEYYGLERMLLEAMGVSLPPLLILMITGIAALVVAAMFDGGGGNRSLAKRARSLGAVGRTGTSHAHESALRRSKDSKLDVLIRRYLPRPAVLRTRLEATGLPISFTHYGVACLAVGLIVLTVALLVGAPGALAVLEAVATGVWLPHIVIGFLMARRRAKFFKSFPEAVALMVRGLRAGLPVSETIGIIGKEIADPVGEEFRRVADQVRLGAPLEAAMWQTAKRLGLAEFNFLVISLSVQRETGGNLAETLENLEHILRRRQQMRLKIKAMSSEAVASAAILTALPFATAVMMYFVSGEYIHLLFTDPLGRMMMAGGMVSMTVGALVMRQMVRFEI